MNEEMTIKGKEVRELPVELTEEEINERGRELPIVMEEIDRIEEEKKNVNADYNGRIKRMKADADKLAREIRTEEKIVSVPCQWEYYWSENVKKMVRTDTGQVLDQLAIQDHERQQQFPAAKGTGFDEEKPLESALSGKDLAAGEKEDDD